MIGSIVTLLILLADPSAAAPPAQAQGQVPEELLKKMAEADARLMRLYKEGAVTMTSHVEEMDKAGKVERTQEISVRLTQEDGKPHSEVLRATRDGQDVTAEERQKQAENRARAEGEPKPRGGAGRSEKAELTTPFGAEQQPKYAFQLLGPDAKDPSLLRVGFSPRGEPSKELWVGEAVVDPATGGVRWMKQRPSKLPAFVDRMEMVLEFNAATPEGNAISSIRMEGQGGLPFFKKRFRVETRFSDYGAK